MKLVFLFSLVLLAALVHESEAGWFRRLGRRIKTTATKVGSDLKEGVGKITSTVRDTVKEGVDTARDHVRSTVRRVFGRLRGKRSALTLNRGDDVNAVDIATTLNLDLPAVKDVFVRCDVDKSNSLDGQEVLSFLHLIEEMATASSPFPSSKH